MVRFAKQAWLPAWAVAFWAGLAAADAGLFLNVTRFDEAAQIQKDFPSQRFRSSPIEAPCYLINKWEKNQVDDAGYIFLGTVYGRDRAGPMILNAKDMSLVYADQQYKNTYCSDSAIIDGELMLGFWHGYHTRGHANGWCKIFDQNYNMRYNVSAQGLHGALADMHEMKMTKDKTVIFTTYFNILANVSSVGGPEEALLQDSGFQEVDMETNEVLFDWAASDHFSINETYARYSKSYGVNTDSGFDFFHINSVDKTDDGNFLVSSRHLSVLTLVDGNDGHPIWILGGKRNQFRDLSDGRATDFGWQHDARFYNKTHITMFDNHSEKTHFCDEEEPCKTRGLHLEINEEEMTARVVREYFHPQRINSGAMGGLQHLDNGNVLMGWGYNPTFVEFKPDGQAVMDIQRGRIGKAVPDMFAYRVHKGAWKGLPTWPPAIAVDTPNQSTMNGTVYLSWNGATEIREWVIFASDDYRALDGGQNVIAQAKKGGFETQIQLPLDVDRRYVGAAAIDAEGVILGSTPVIDMTTGGTFVVTSQITSLDSLPDDQTKGSAKAIDWDDSDDSSEDGETEAEDEKLMDWEDDDSGDAAPTSTSKAGESPEEATKTDIGNAKATETNAGKEEKAEAGGNDPPSEQKTAPAMPSVLDGQKWAYAHDSDALTVAATVLLFITLAYAGYYLWKRSRISRLYDSEKAQASKLAED